jgi:DnaK suppressor protein
MAKITTLSNDFIKKITKDLEDKKIKIEEELSKFTHKNVRVEGDYDSNFPEYGDKEDENAAEVAEYITNKPLEESLEKTLRDVIKSLDSIKKGTYGVCKYCGKPIDEKRLEARPTSSACVDCKKAITQEI